MNSSFCYCLHRTIVEQCRRDPGIPSTSIVVLPRRSLSLLANQMLDVLYRRRMDTSYASITFFYHIHVRLQCLCYVCRGLGDFA